MKKIIKSSHLIALIIALCVFHISVFSQTCVNCDTLRQNVSIGYLNTINTTEKQQTVIGYNNTTGNNNAVAVGSMSKAIGSHSYVFGSFSESKGIHSYVFGSDSEARTLNSFAIGVGSKSMSISSMAIGNFVETYGQSSIVLGMGSYQSELVHNIPHSLAVGFGSTIPTFFVGGAPGPTSTGNVGIATTNPLQKLDVNGNVRISGSENTLLFDGAQSGKIVFNSGSGNIGTAEERQPLHFYTSGQNLRMTIDGVLGYVGIRQENPGSELDVNGTIRIVSEATELRQLGDMLSIRSQSQANVALFTSYGLNLPLPSKPYNLTLAGSIQLGATDSDPKIGFRTGDLRFMADDTERMRIKANGKVGIGIDDPKSKLQVHGTISVGYDTHNPDNVNNLIVEGNVGIGTFAPGEKLDVNGKIRTQQLQITENYNAGFLLLADAQGNAVWTNPETITNIGPWSRQGDNVYVEGFRKVGIGTSQPQEALHVNGNIRLGTYGNIKGNRDSWQSFKIFAGSDENDAYISLHSSYNQAGSIKMYCRGTSGRIEFHNDNMQVMSIRADNNVYIGDGDPEKSSNLYVNGHIRANLVRVNTDTWWDQVFAPDYNLMPLSDLSSFIATNGHLPDIPTEAEALESGIDLGEMNGLLLKKIEELTLYLLEQDRKINTLQTELQQIKNAGHNN